MSASAGIPLPRPSALSAPFWAGCREGRLRVQRCRSCGRCIFIPQAICTHCLSDALDWVDGAGRGSLYSFTTVHRPPSPGFAVPYVVAIVELDEGYHMLTNLVDCPPERLCVGLRVEVTFRRMSDEITLPLFRPSDASGNAR